MAAAPLAPTQWLYDQAGNPLSAYIPGAGWVGGPNVTGDLGDKYSSANWNDQAVSNYQNYYAQNPGAPLGSQPQWAKPFDPSTVDLTGLTPQQQAFFKPDVGTGLSGTLVPQSENPTEWTVYGDPNDPNVWRPSVKTTMKQPQGTFFGDVMEGLSGGKDAPIPGWGPGVFFAGAAGALAAGASAAAASSAEGAAAAEGGAAAAEVGGGLTASEAAASDIALGGTGGSEAAALLGDGQVTGTGAAAGFGFGDVWKGIKTASSILSPISSLISAASVISSSKNRSILNQAPQVAPPVTMPIYGSPDTLNAMSGSVQDQLMRRGRAATILTSPDSGTQLGS